MPPHTRRYENARFRLRLIAWKGDGIMDLQAQITRVRELMQQRANIDKELAGYKELADILKPKVARKKRKVKTETPPASQNTMKM